MKEQIEQPGPNRLIHERSPYLIQHAYNPVDWYPWGEEAFRRAAEENKPIFLSIGYSTCHWCHVMAHESFEDPEVARLLNEAFVNIKVDREERPDIDGVYMEICNMMTGRGGWPLTIIMTPDKKPFFAATYIPRASRMGQPGLLSLIPKIREFWILQRTDALIITRKIEDALREVPRMNVTGAELGSQVLDRAYEGLAGRFDDDHGGFGTAPKFPSPHNLLFLLRYWKRSGNEKALQMVEKTLQSMRRGGINDQIGFGFHRYSTDQSWVVPHFEKMLYDQALIAIAYTEAYQATGHAEYEEAAREIFTYVLRDLKSPGGGFFSAEDADSEGEEGKFYLWKVEELRTILSGPDLDFALKVFNVDVHGNFLEESTGRKTGENILHLKKSPRELARDEGIGIEEFDKILARIRKILMKHRDRRIRPGLDDKILTDWNGLMIAALAKGAQVFGDREYELAAADAVNFINEKMRTPQGKLLHRFREDRAGIPAFLDDHAFLVWGLLELYEATFKTGYLKEAIELNNEMISHFWDSSGGGFYFTADYGEELMIRKKEIYDGAVPSGNSVAMLNLLRLSRITGDWSLEEKAEVLAHAFSRTITEAPHAYTYLLLALDFAEGPSYEVVVVGDRKSMRTGEIINVLRKDFLPAKVVLFRPTDEDASDISRLAPFTESYKPAKGRTIAYVCYTHDCKAPITSPDELREFFNSKGAVGV